MSVRIHPQVFFDEAGKPRTVLLDVEEYRALLEEVRDTQDLRDLEAAMARSEGTVPLEDMFAELDAEQT